MVEHHSPGNRYVLELVRELKNQCDLTVYCNRHNDLQEDGIRWIRRFYDGGKGKAGAIADYGRTLLDLAREIRFGHYDILHIQSFKRASTEMKLYYSMRKYYKKLVMTVHNVLPHEPAPGDMALYRRFYQACDHLIVHNDASRNELQEKFGIPDEKISVIPRGLYTTYEVGQNMRDDDTRTHFLCFGRIRPYKGVDILLKAISLMQPEDRSKCLFTIRGEQYPKLDPADYPALIRQYGIEDCVDFSSSRVPEDEIPALIGNADYLVFPYRKIYGSGVLLMAYTYQVPVIASNVPTFVEGTDNGKAGLLFNSEDPAALKDVLLRALEVKPEQIEEYRSAIRDIVATRHNWTVTARQTVEVYHKVLTEYEAPRIEGQHFDTGPVDSFLKECADSHYDEFMESGHASPGCNGPYGCPDTPVRNTAHWLIIYSYLWKITKDEKYHTIAQKFGEYLLDAQRHSRSGAVACIGDNWPDQLNGMIGQGWVIEALIYAYETFNDPDYLNCAVMIFHAQEFDQNTGFWKKIEPDGSNTGFDYTLNHQIWFAIGGMLILQHYEDAEIREQVECHLKYVDHEYFGIHPDGLIRHYGAMKRPRKPFNYLYLKQYVKYAGLKLKVLRPEKTDIKVQEEGYHLFELFGYAQIARLDNSYHLFKKKDFKKALDYSRSIDDMNRRLGTDSPQTMNKYAYGYNSPAFEVPMIDLMFRGGVNEKKILELLELQKKLTYNAHTRRMDRNTYDPETLTARLYEYVCFCDQCRK